MKKTIALLAIALPAITLLATPLPGASAGSQKSPVYQKPDVLTAPGDVAIVIDKSGRAWQGAAPGIARTRGGRLFACLFSGGKHEPQNQNYAIYMVSDDDGKTWIDPFLVIDHPDEMVRIFDPSLWVDPLGRLWIYWNHSQVLPPSPNNKYPRGIWAIRVDNPDAPLDDVRRQIRAFAPVRQFDGIRINKPIVLSTGEWLQPVSNTARESIPILVSTDEGETWSRRGGISIRFGNQNGLEPMVVEKKDGTLWCLARIGFRPGNSPDDKSPNGGVAQSFSSDGGRAWTTPEADLPHPLIGAQSRLFLGRLQSGALLHITNDSLFRRRMLTAFLSEDDGKTWPWRLVLDDRDGIATGTRIHLSPYLSGPSYPDCVQAPDGRVYVVWDFGRYHEKEMRLSIFTEADIKAGAFITPAARDKLVVSRASPFLDIKEVRTSFPRILSLNQGGDLQKLLGSLPKKITVADEKGRAHTLSGQWVARVPVPGKPGQYAVVNPSRPGRCSLVFTPGKSVPLLDTFHLLRAILDIVPAGKDAPTTTPCAPMRLLQNQPVQSNSNTPHP